MKQRLLTMLWITGIAHIIASTGLFAQTAGLANSNGIQIAYEAFGDSRNEAMIMIQGTGATMLHYPAEMCRQLAERGFWVIRFDNRDIGLSSKLDSLGQPDWAAIVPFYRTCDPAPLPYTLLDMAKDVTGLMDALNIKKAHVVGASMGGAIAQLIAIHFPDRVLTLTCIASTTGNPDRPAGDPNALQSMSAQPPDTNNADSIAAYLVRTYRVLGASDNDSVLYARALGHIERSWYPVGTTRQVAAVFIGDYCDRRIDLAKVNIPTFVIQGDADPIVTLDAGEELAQSIPGADFHVIAGMGHDFSLKFVNEICSDIVGNARKVNP
jgi:pimeloyl-ACP methyl ester carboxylesterase